MTHPDARVIVFRSRLRPGIERDTGAMAGFASATDFVAADGERLALIELDSAAELAAWRDHPPHYATYSLQVCSVAREARFDGTARTSWERDPAAAHAIATRWLACFEARDLDGLLALYADDATHTSPKIRARHPDTGGKLRGKPALRAWWADAFERLPDMHYVPTSITADGDRAIVEYVRTVPGEPDLPVAETFELVDGRIAASRVYHG